VLLDNTQITSITTGSGDTTFNFSGGTFYVSLYACYPKGGGNTPDTDPTGDKNQFITSYKVTMPNDPNLPVPPRPAVEHEAGPVRLVPPRIIANTQLPAPTPLPAPISGALPRAKWCRGLSLWELDLDVQANLGHLRFQRPRLPGWNVGLH